MDEKQKIEESHFLISCRQFMIGLSLTGCYPWSIPRNWDKRPRFVIWPIIIMLFVLLLNVVMAVYLLYHYLQAITRANDKLDVTLHMLSNVQYLFVAFLALPLNAYTNRHLYDCVVALDRILLPSTYPRIIQIKKHILGQASLLIAAVVVMYYLKIYPAIGLYDTLFGIKIPGAPWMFFMQFILTNAMFSRLASVCAFCFLGLTSAVQFRACYQQIKEHVDVELTDLSSINTALHRHLELSRIHAHLDTVFAPATLFYCTTDVTILIFLLNFVLNFKMDTALGLYSMDRVEHRFISLIGGIGSVMLLLIKVGVSCYLHDQAHSVVPILYRLLHRMENSAVEQEERSKTKGWRALCTLTVQRLRDFPIEFSGWGLFTLDKQLIATIVGLSVSYLLVMSEMGKKDATICNCTAIACARTSG
ncbi:uncharacterized protein LOC129595484 [Paramacrobiotus metropolitanus]|uniref:uncharacterized protein LOC129595484 n=1 Tax=Paramacrobiotus metropolitanus TaxID=2943436 RepID=UPI002445C6BC|nr:uncharacterized protein LOC129595484 [Paramacrobiotus metropolitanus]